MNPLRPPKWRPPKAPASVPTTGELLRLLRYEYWAGALRPGNFYRFVTGTRPHTTTEKCPPDLPATLLAAA